MIIRRSIPADAAKIAELETAIFPDPWSQTDIAAAISVTGAMCYTALGDDGEIYAYVLGRTIAPEGEIYRVATAPERRQRGIAFRLMTFAIKTEKGSGLENLFLEVRSQNLAAIKLYASLSFKQIGRRKNYYKNPDDDAILMMRSSEPMII